MLLLRGTRHISGAQWPHMAGGCCIRRHRRPSQHHRKPAGQRGSLDSLDSVPSFRCSGRDFHRPLEGIWTLSTKPSAPAPPSAGSHHHPAHCRAGCRPSRETACAPRVLSTPSAGAPAQTSGVQWGSLDRPASWLLAGTRGALLFSGIHKRNLLQAPASKFS